MVDLIDNLDAYAERPFGVSEASLLAIKTFLLRRLSEEAMCEAEAASERDPQVFIESNEAKLTICSSESYIFDAAALRSK